MTALPGLGVVLHRSTSKNAEAMARCLADVAARIPEEAPIRLLTSAEEQEPHELGSGSLSSVDRKISAVGLMGRARDRD